jgi:hypothetical protein
MCDVGTQGKDFLLRSLQYQTTMMRQSGKRSLHESRIFGSAVYPPHILFVLSLRSSVYSEIPQPEKEAGLLLQCHIEDISIPPASSQS